MVASYVPFSESLEFLTRHDLADLLGEPHPLEDFADVFATDDISENLKSFLSPRPDEANCAPSRALSTLSSSLG
jgi:hypothetical protein